MLYHVQTGECLRSFSCRASYSLWSCISPDNRLVAVADDKDILIFELETGQRIATLTGHRDEINRVIFTADGQKLLSCSCDGTAILWNLRTGRPIQIFGEHFGYVTSCCLSPDETLVLTGDYRGIIREWDTKTGRLWNQYQAHNGHIRSLCISADNVRSLSVGADLILKLLYVNAGYCETEIAMGLPPVSSLCFEKYGDRVFVFNGERGKNAIIDAQSGRYLQTIDNSEAQGSAYYPFSDGRTWLFLTDNNSALSLMTIPTFRHHSALDLCKIETSKKVAQLEEDFSKQIKEINQFIEKEDIAAALERADELIKMPVWGNTKAVLEIRRKVGKYCIKTSISHITKDSTVSWIESLYDIGRSAMTGVRYVFAFSPTRLITAFADTYATPRSGVEGRSIRIREAKTGKLITTWDANEGCKTAYYELEFNKEGTELWANGKTLNLDSKVTDMEQQTNAKGLIEYLSAQYTYRIDEHISLPKSDKEAKAVFFSEDGNQIGAVYHPSSDDDNCCEYVTYDIDWEYHFPGWQNWDEGARPYLEIFLTLHPDWSDADFNNILIPDLQNRGYGWLRPEGVRIKLDELQFGW